MRLRKGHNKYKTIDLFMRGKNKWAKKYSRIQAAVFDSLGCQNFSVPYLEAYIRFLKGGNVTS